MVGPRMGVNARCSVGRTAAASSRQQRSRGPADGATGKDDDMDSSSSVELVLSYYDAINRRDESAYAELFDPEVEMVAPGGRRGRRGCTDARSRRRARLRP